jgi:ElaB/YqjD/DUF883 family membrane-anchored ribosome-binding protein
MASVTVETPDATQKPSVGARVASGCRQAANLSHDARALRTAAEDAIEDGVHVARRAIISARRRVEELVDLRDEAIHRVKRQPATAIGIAAGAGLAFGIALGWMGGRWFAKKVSE